MDSNKLPSADRRWLFLHGEPGQVILRPEERHWATERDTRSWPHPSLYTYSDPLIAPASNGASDQPTAFWRAAGNLARRWRREEASELPTGAPLPSEVPPLPQPVVVIGPDGEPQLGISKFVLPAPADS